MQFHKIFHLMFRESIGKLQPEHRVLLNIQATLRITCRWIEWARTAHEWEFKTSFLHKARTQCIITRWCLINAWLLQKSPQRRSSRFWHRKSVLPCAGCHSHRHFVLHSWYITSCLKTVPISRQESVKLHTSSQFNFLFSWLSITFLKTMFLRCMYTYRS